MPIANVGRNVVPRRDVPAERPIDFVVGPHSFHGHSTRKSRFTMPYPAIEGSGRIAFSLAGKQKVFLTFHTETCLARPPNPCDCGPVRQSRAGETGTILLMVRAGADGATAPETLRHQGPRCWTIWREALGRAHRRGHSHGAARKAWRVRVKLSGTATDGARLIGFKPIGS
jgi:hypothetical protein